MALASCRECGKQVSTEAKACPHCGVVDPIKKHWSNFTLAGLAVFGILIFVGVSDWTKQSSPPTPQAAAPSPPRDPALLKQDADLVVKRFAENKKAEADAKVAKARTCVQEARTNGEDITKATRRCSEAASKPLAPPPAPIDAKAQQEKTFQVVVVAMKLIQKNLREPESVVWEDVRANDNATVICILYRARNGFGGMARERFAIDKTGASQSAEFWNRVCANKPLSDLIHAKHAL